MLSAQRGTGLSRVSERYLCGLEQEAPAALHSLLPQRIVGGIGIVDGRMA